VITTASRRKRRNEKIRPDRTTLCYSNVTIQRSKPLQSLANNSNQGSSLAWYLSKD